MQIDIEGSEKEIFSNHRDPGTGVVREWLKRSQVVMAEAHDDIAFGSLEALEAAMKARGDIFQKSTSGELHIWRFPK